MVIIGGVSWWSLIFFAMTLVLLLFLQDLDIVVAAVLLLMRIHIRLFILDHHHHKWLIIVNNDIISIFLVLLFSLLLLFSIVVLSLQLILSYGHFLPFLVFRWLVGRANGNFAMKGSVFFLLLVLDLAAKLRLFLLVHKLGSSLIKFLLSLLWSRHRCRLRCRIETATVLAVVWSLSTLTVFSSAALTRIVLARDGDGDFVL